MQHVETGGEAAHNRLPARDRYERDPAFRQLVDMLYMQIRNANYTPTELREAVMLAATMHESYTVRRYVVSDTRLADQHTCNQFGGILDRRCLACANEGK